MTDLLAALVPGVLVVVVGRAWWTMLRECAQLVRARRARAWLRRTGALGPAVVSAAPLDPVPPGLDLAATQRSTAEAVAHRRAAAEREASAAVHSATVDRPVQLHGRYLWGPHG